MSSLLLQAVILNQGRSFTVAGNRQPDQAGQHKPEDAEPLDPGSYSGKISSRTGGPSEPRNPVFFHCLWGAWLG